MIESEQKSLNHVLEELAIQPVPILAGGTDFYPALQDQSVPEFVLDLTQVAGLRYISETDAGWEIGAATTWTDIVRAELPPVFDGLKAAAREVGSIQIQNTGTVAGNLCNASPAADGVPPLLSLNATVELACAVGRRKLSLHEFILGPRSTALREGELLVAVHIPRVASQARGDFVKLGARRYLVISIVMVSVVLVPDSDGSLIDVRIAVGACSAVARRMSALEEVLLSCSIHDDLASLVLPSLLSDLTPIDDVRGSGVYRSRVAQQLICRLLSSTARALSADQDLKRSSEQSTTGNSDGTGHPGNDSERKA